MSDDQHLRKNENDYWLCPLCGHALIYDSNPDELYCPKMVDVQRGDTGGIRWNHFDIQPCKDGPNKGQTRWVAVIPPFYVSWYKETGILFVKQFGTHKEDWRMQDILDCRLGFSEEDLLKLYKRLNNLKVFA